MVLPIKTAVITKIDKSKNRVLWFAPMGIFSDMNSIFALINELESKYGQSLLVEQAELNGKSIFKVFIESNQNRAYADALKIKKLIR